MSRRLSKKSRATKLATNVAFSAANLPKLETSVLDALFARSPARKRSVRASLMVGTVLSAGILTGAGMLLDASPAFAGTCTPQPPSGAFVLCTGVFPTPTTPGPFTLVGIGNTGGIIVQTATVGGNSLGDGFAQYAGATGQTLIVTADAASKFGIGAAYGITRSAIHMYSSFTGTTLSVSNAASIGAGTTPVGSAGIFAFINDGAQSAADSISIANSAANPIYSVANSVEGEIRSTAATATAQTDTVTISNSGPVGSAKNPTSTGAGIYGTIVLLGNGVATSNVTNTAPVYAADGGVDSFATVRSGFYSGSAKAYSNATNSGNLTSTAAAEATLRGFAYASDLGKGSVATAAVTVTNAVTGTITSGAQGIYGDSTAKATNTGTSVAPGTTITGGLATATVTITNAAADTTKGATAGQAIYGSSSANALASATASNAAQGGSAKATTTVSNSGALGTADGANGLDGFATAIAAGFSQAGGTASKDNATGGSASAVVTITNASTGAMTVAGGAIDGVSSANANAYGAGNATGGTAGATTSILNAATLNAAGGGIYGSAREDAEAFGGTPAAGKSYSATGGVAPATVSISNSGNMTSLFGVGGYANAGAGAIGFVAKGGTATATTTVSNSGNLVTRYDGVYGYAVALSDTIGGAGKGGSATGGTSTASVKISNTGNITAGNGNTFAQGIYGNSFASASGGVIVIPLISGAPGSLFPIIIPAYTATGGTATATTSISNSGSLNVKPADTGEGITGTARAFADAFALYTKGSVATAGTATATTSLSNSGAIYNAHGSSLRGYSRADTDASGYKGLAGTSTASTTIYNSGSLESLHYTGIHGMSYANANAYGNTTAAKGLGTGGTATAGVLITNVAAGTVQAGAGNGFYASGMVAQSGARANGNGYVGKGGTASATTSITNAASVSAFYGNGMLGFSYASAVGFSPTVTSTALNGAGTGGTATATTSISNSGAIYSGTFLLSGIDGISFANASGVGFTGTGGTATATTNISNSGAITGIGQSLILGPADAGIYGFAIAIAGGYGAFAVEPGKGVGGTAKATTSITNSGNMYSIAGDGILGFSLARADGFGTIAVGGTATAITSISNTGNIYSFGYGIDGIAISHATAVGSYGIAGSAKGGTATATVTISNTGNINSYDAGGISGYASAHANGDGKGGVGGTAVATTTISNTGAILSTINNGNYYGNRLAGIYGGTDARAHGYKSGGTATATTLIINTGSIKTYGQYAPGIYATSYANADPTAGNSTGGTATATTSVTNGGSIITLLRGSPGIAAYSYSDALAHKGGTATSTTSVTNSNTITTVGGNWSRPSGNNTSIPSVPSVIGSGAATSAHSPFWILELEGSPGIVAGSAAYSSGTAKATTIVTNLASGAIATEGPVSPGIFAFSFAEVDPSTPSSAYASTTVNNAAPITTLSWGSPGIVARSAAYGYGFSTIAKAVTTVSNGGAITTYGGHSDGIYAYSFAASDPTAITTVTNTGNITTFGHRSDGIVAGSAVFGGLGDPAVASTTVSNSGAILTSGRHSPGIYAFAIATSATNSATATVVVSNSGSVITTGSHSAAVATYAFAGATNPLSANASITIVNTATGVIAAYHGFYQFGYHAITAGGAKATISNSGFIHGNVQLAAFNNVFNNTATGLWAMQGDSNFGGKGSVVNNAGTVSSILPGSYQSSNDPGTRRQTFSTVTLYGLEMFNNSGLVTMVDGSPNDRIVITGPTSLAGNKVYFNGTGNSTLAVDASLGGPPTRGFGFGRGGFGGAPASSADVLQIGTAGSKGYVTGLTNVVVNDVSPNLPGAYNPVGIPVAESNGAANVVLTSHTVAGVTISGPANSASNFEMLQGPIQKGFFSYGLFYLPKNEAGPCQAGFNCWFLASTPSRAALEFTQLGTAANDIWSDAAGMWLDRNADLRDYFFMAGSNPNARGGGADLAVKAPIAPPPPAGVGPGAWVRAYGDWIDNKQNASFSAFGTTLTSSVQYNQTIAGAQMGYDWAFMRTGFSAVLVGLMGGADGSTVNFGSGNKVTFQGGNAGAYATFLNHGFFADGLFLANWMSMDYTAGGTLFGGGVPNTGVNANVQQYGGRIDTGYRFQFNPWFFEPQLTAEVVHTNFGNLPFPSVGTTVQVDDDTSVRGRLGGRLGTSFVTGAWRIEPSVTGGVWETLSGNNGAVLTSNGFALDLTDPSNNKTQGEVGGMLNFYQLGTNWSAFVKGDYRFASEYTSGSVKGGVRYQW